MSNEPKKLTQRIRYSDKLASDICERLANGESLVAICKSDGFPCYATVMNWLWQESDFKDRFLERYARARDMQADFLADEITEIADDASYDWDERIIKGKAIVIADHENIQRSHLRVEARKWVAAKLKPKKYSEKFFQEIHDSSKDIVVEVTHGDGNILDDKIKLPGLDASADPNSPIKDET